MVPNLNCENLKRYLRFMSFRNFFQERKRMEKISGIQPVCRRDRDEKMRIKQKIASLKNRFRFPIPVRLWREVGNDTSTVSL